MLRALCTARMNFAPQIRVIGLIMVHQKTGAGNDMLAQKRIK